jgi:hypothetical protein
MTAGMIRNEGEDDSVQPCHTESAYEGAELDEAEGHQDTPGSLVSENDGG